MVQHPDWDIEFKPAIARYDWDQTYDVLEFVYLPQGFNQLINLYGIPAFEVMAIDRFTPYRYRWADQYSDKVYEFLKNFNFSPHNSINERLLRDEANQLIFDLSGHPRWKNEWVSGNSYSNDDVVSYNSRFYQCITANSDNDINTSKWNLLNFLNYIWSDTRLRKFDYIQYSGRYFVTKTDNAFSNPPIADDGTVDNNWLEISITVPKFEYDMDKYNEFFDLSSHPRVVGEWKRQDYLKGDLVEWEGKHYIATNNITIDRNSYSPLSGFVQPYLMRWDQTDIQEFQLDNIVLYHDGKFYMPLVDGATLPLWNDRSLPPPTLNSSDWTEIDFISYNTTLDKGRYQITGLLYQDQQEGLTGSIPTINQTFAEFTLAESTEIDINQILWNRWLKDDYFPDNNTNRFCSNSLVISKLSNGNWVNYTPSFTDKPTWLLFEDISTYFNDVKQQLINYFQNIYDGFIGYFTGYFVFPDLLIAPLQSYLQKSVVKYSFGKNEPDLQHYTYATSYGTFIDENGTPYNIPHPLQIYSYSYNYTVETIGLNYLKFPSYMVNNCYLARANNNKWSMQTNYNDLGNVPKPNNKYGFLDKLISDILQDKYELNMYQNNNYPAFLSNKPNNYLIDWNFYTELNNYSTPDNSILKNSRNKEAIKEVSNDSLPSPSLFPGSPFVSRFYDAKAGINIRSGTDWFYSWWGWDSLSWWGDVVPDTNKHLPFHVTTNLNLIFSNPEPKFYTKYITKKESIQEIRDRQWDKDVIIPDYEGTWYYYYYIAIHDIEYQYGIAPYLPPHLSPTQTTNVAEFDFNSIGENYFRKTIRRYNRDYWGDIHESDLANIPHTHAVELKGGGKVLGWETMNIEITGEITPNNLDVFTREPSWELELYTQQEWQELYEYEAMTDQEYLDYLLQLKAEWEEQNAR